MRLSPLLPCLSLAAALALAPCCRAAEEIFWEAEETNNTTMSPDGPYRALTTGETSKLSGGRWLNGSLTANMLYAEYKIEIPAAGEYRLFARKFWQHGALRWKVDEGEWSEIRKKEILNTVVLREYVPLCWVLMGEIHLSAGEHTIRIEALEDSNYEFSKTYGLDCFLLTQTDLNDFLEAHPTLGSDEP